MKVCPKCKSTNVRYSHTRTPSEIFFRTRLGYRFYRCQQCNWRGMLRPEKTKNKYSGKKNIWLVLGMDALILFLVLFILKGCM